MTEASDQIGAMLGQEVLAYGTSDYLAPSFRPNLSFPGMGEAESTSVSVDSSSSGITELWREKICEWCYQVIDHFDFSREVVSIAMNYLDRYLATKIVNKKVFQLAAMTALFLAVKLHERSKLSMSSMIELSRGCFTVNQMAAMEISLIRSLRWNLHPPTSQSFVQRFLLLLPSTGVNSDILYDVLELSRFLTELSVIDYFFVSHRPSKVALAALANAMEDIASVPVDAQIQFAEILRSQYDIDVVSSSSILECRRRLRALCALQGNLAATNGSSLSSPSSDQHGLGASPVCVSYGVSVYQEPTGTLK